MVVRVDLFLVVFSALLLLPSAALLLPCVPPALPCLVPQQLKANESLLCCVFGVFCHLLLLDIAWVVKHPVICFFVLSRADFVKN